MPNDSRVLPVGPVRLTMPEGCTAELFCTFNAPDERLEVSSYLETEEGGPKEVAARRLKSARAVVGESVEVLREQSDKIRERAACVTVLRCKESNGQTGTLCQMLLELAPKRFLELQYEFGQHSKGSLKDFDRVTSLLRLQSDSTQDEGPPSVPIGWVSCQLPSVTICRPPRLRRASPYSFVDATKNLRWSADAWVLGAIPEATNSIPPEASSPMTSGKRDEAFNKTNVAGSITVLRTTDPEMGVAGDRIARGEVVVGRRAKVIIRGVGPDSLGDRLEGDLKSMLEHITLSEP